MLILLQYAPKYPDKINGILLNIGGPLGMKIQIIFILLTCGPVDTPRKNTINLLISYGFMRIHHAIWIQLMLVYTKNSIVYYWGFARV